MVDCAASVERAIRTARRESVPFDHWLLESVLPEPVLDGILELPYDPPPVPLEAGTREANNATRVFFNPCLCNTHVACAQTAAAFHDPRAIAAIERTCGIDLAGTQLRIEYCQDTDGFWLEPHTDIAPKTFTMLVYLSREPEAADLGTDLYDSEKRWAARAPAPVNSGLIFVPGPNTWHGFAPRPFPCVRRSLIVNYVSADWRAVHELNPPAIERLGERVSAV